MITLAIDSTTDRLSLALSHGVLREKSRDGARQHARAVFPLIEELLAEAAILPRDLERLIVADGPGGFTGLRVGAALVKSWARTRPGLELWSASTLMVRAAGAGAPAGSALLVATSALRGELFAAQYRVALPVRVDTIFPPRLATVESLHDVRPDLVIADGPDKLIDRLGSEFGVPLIRGVASLPRASALLGLAGVPGGATRILDVEQWEPFYGRQAEAQVRWEAAHGRALSDPAGPEPGR